ncbi:probable LRR receptor-like serine/threonine-protein kinase At1g67720 isoform X2 [Aristolochia californica]|uniref:probable LRR receptor-like serine/threonine-protein kinase At1g67720 isoform X2 n=1 Tax=Aristolochia californica TaxID=171875 RepID=UPI0035D697E0
MEIVLSALVLLLQLIPFVASQSKEFVSLDCGGGGNYTDTNTGFNWVSDATFILQGKATEVKASNETRQQYKYRRDFPADNKKYCYTLGTVQRRRYLVRATFYYGNSESEETFPRFDLYLDSTKWDTVSITDSSRTYIKEMIIRAPSTSVDVCLCCVSTGSPFISTLELRPLNLSMYATDYENEFYLAVATRVNFGALSAVAIRYPDDPFDRIWESDLERRPNFLVGIAPGTERINTSKNIKTDNKEFPPVKVMQTAVVGTRGSLTYRINLEGFPAYGRTNARALAYLAEIEELELNETRKFTLSQPSVPGYRDIVVNIAENADENYKLYEPSYMNISLPFVLSFAFTKTPDSTRGPLLNAIEISRYVHIVPRTDTQDSIVLNELQAMAAESDWATENGDPCNPIPWHWVKCSSSAPPSITKIVLSGKNLNGTIPPKINQMRSLSELWLDGNFLSGPIPDMSELSSLTIVHLENNRLTGQLPSYLGDLPSLRELYVHNNSFSGEIPPSLLTGKFLFKYDGNPELHEQKKNWKLIIGASVGAFAFLVVLLFGSFFLLQHLHRKPSEPNAEGKYNSSRMMSKRSSAFSLVRGGSTLIDEGQEIAYITLSELQGATQNFNKKIGKGSFGPVFYGKMKDGKEVAAKIMADSSLHGTRQFVNEVSLLSRIHHRNLVPLIGYCEEGSQRILVYEYMHNGSLRDQLHEAFGLVMPSLYCRRCCKRS